MPSSVSNPSILIVLNAHIVKDPAAVKAVTDQFASAQTDVHRQVLDRLLERKAQLPPNNYSLIYVAQSDTLIKLDGQTLQMMHDALVPGGKLAGAFDFAAQTMDAIMAGLLESPDKTSYTKPEANSVASIARPAASGVPKTGKRLPIFKKAAPVMLSLNDLNDDDDDDLVDENSLVSSAISTPIIIPPQCQPTEGKKRRKACKDCTCGLKELELQEQEAQLAKQSSAVVTLNLDEEIDFTVPGKAGGSCGSCALGDAFRCDGCPYLGLPPFKPGEIVNISAVAADI